MNGWPATHGLACCTPMQGRAMLLAGDLHASIHLNYLSCCLSRTNLAEPGWSSRHVGRHGMPQHGVTWHSTPALRDTPQRLTRVGWNSRHVVRLECSLSTAASTCHRLAAGACGAGCLQVGRRSMPTLRSNGGGGIPAITDQCRVSLRASLGAPRHCDVCRALPLQHPKPRTCRRAPACAASTAWCRC